MKHLLPLSALLVGVALTAFAGAHYCGTGLPYPDPTPDLLAGQRADLRLWGTLTLVGAALAAVSLVALAWSERRAAREARDAHDGAHMED